MPDVIERLDLEEIREYRERIRGYSAEELEDVYFNIDVLRNPVRYRLLAYELEQRALKRAPEAAPPRAPDLKAWLESKPLMRRHPLLKGALLGALLFSLTAAVTFGLLSPIWVFSVPFKFVGLQTSIIYLACAPVPPIVAAGIGGRLGGRGVYGLYALLGVAAGIVAFSATGAPAAILHWLVEPQGSGGGLFSM